MRASIIIPCYNHGRYLAEAIESALAQTLPAWEVLVVDDGSTDDSCAIAARYDVKLLARSHLGAPATMGAGVDASSGDCFAMLGADDRLAPNYLEVTVPVLAANADAGFVYSSTTLFGSVDRFLPAREFSRARLLAANYVHATALTRRAAYDQTPGYAATDLPLYEDWSLFLSMVERGWKGYAADGTTLYYRQHGATRNQLGGPEHEQTVRRIMQSHPSLYRPSPNVWYWLHRRLFRRLPRLYVGLLMAAGAVWRRPKVVE